MCYFYTLDRPGLLRYCDEGQRILIAGAGGGYDVFSGLPLYHHLRKAGKEVFLANLSFSNLEVGSGTRPTPSSLLVNDTTEGMTYFPEKFLCEWFRGEGEDVEICCFSREGAAPLRGAYEAICSEWNIDTVLLVDGGTDSLMRGDEVGLGTPQEDIASIAAVSSLEVPRKALACIGFGVDAYHGVCHAQFLEAVAGLIKSGDYLGVFSLEREMEEAQFLFRACDHVFQRMRHHRSIVASSIISAVQGEFGNYHAIDRTGGSELFINPLMGLYWSFKVDGIANRCLYLDEVKDTVTYSDLSMAINVFRAKHPEIKDWSIIPV
jgi:hypothetical protein